MLTGEQYKASLDDGRLTYFEGERVTDIVNDPILGPTADFTAQAYDRFYDPDPAAVSPLLGVPRSSDDLRELIPLLVEAGIIDAAKVTRSALQNAGSIAALFLTTEAVIADAPDEGAGGGMPDMDF